MTNNAIDISEVYDKIDVGFETFGGNEEIKSDFYVPTIDYDIVEDELDRLIKIIDEKLFLEGKYPSLFIFGPTGVGKTEICEALANKHGYIYHKLEIQKVPIEQFEGFPWLQDIEKDGEPDKNVRTAHPTVLPPSGDEDKWILHLDEFNKASPEKMAAVMNLVLNGEIGGSADFNKKTGKSTKYKLPKRTIILGSGNPRSQGDHSSNFNLVHSMDIATAERFHRTLLLDYNAHSWLKAFGNKEYIYHHKGTDYKLFSRVAPILNYFIITKAANENPAFPFQILVHSNKEDSEDNERSLSPRSWTFISDAMLYDAIIQWEMMNNKEKTSFVKVALEKFEDETLAFTCFFINPKKQVELLYKQHAEFGVESDKIVGDIASSFNYYSLNRIRPTDILFKYQEVRNQIVQKTKEQNILLTHLISLVARTLFAVKETERKKIKLLALNLSTFLGDLKVGAEDLAMFVSIVNIKGGRQKKFRNDVHNLLLSMSGKYKEAFKNFRYSEGLSLRKKDEEDAKEALTEEEKKKAS